MTTRYVFPDAGLYAGGGFHESPAILDRDAADPDIGSGIRLVEPSRQPAFSYQRPIDPEAIVATEPFKSQLLAHFEHVNRVFPVGAASVLARLDEAYIRPKAISVLVAGEQRLVYETHRQIDREVVSADTELQVSDLETGDANCLWVGSAGSDNYGHWLVDDLARIAAALPWLSVAGRRGRLLLTSFSPEMNTIREQSVQLLTKGEIDLEITFLSRDSLHRARPLYYMTPLSYHPVVKNPWAINHLHAKLINKLDDLPSSPGRTRGPETRIFVSRRGEGGRTLANLDAVEQALHRRGFTTVFPEEHSFAEQVRLFHDATVIVGIMGAAMTNCIFSAADATIIFLVPDGWFEPFYWDLCSVRGQAYISLFGPVTSGGSYRGDFAVDTATLIRLVDRA